MPYTRGDDCGNCYQPKDLHCQTCWSCQGEPVEECCMEGWPEESKALERKRWAKEGEKDDA